MVTKACHEVGNLDARQTDANMLAFSDGDLEILKIKRETPGELKNVPTFDFAKTKRIRYGDFPSPQLNLNFNLLTLYLRIVHQTSEIQICKVKIKSAPYQKLCMKEPRVVSSIMRL